MTSRSEGRGGGLLGTSAWGVLLAAVVAGGLACRSPRGPGALEPSGGSPSLAAVDPKDFPGTLPPGPAAPGRPLSASELAKVLARMKPLPSEAAEQKDFALRERSLPPP